MLFNIFSIQKSQKLPKIHILQNFPKYPVFHKICQIKKKSPEAEFPDIKIFQSFLNCRKDHKFL